MAPPGHTIHDSPPMDGTYHTLELAGRQPLAGRLSAMMPADGYAERIDQTMRQDEVDLSEHEHYTVLSFDWL
jgi:hypothetical protein